MFADPHAERVARKHPCVMAKHDRERARFFGPGGGGTGSDVPALIVEAVIALVVLNGTFASFGSNVRAPIRCLWADAAVADVATEAFDAIWQKEVDRLARASDWRMRGVGPASKQDRRPNCR